MIGMKQLLMTMLASTLITLGMAQQNDGPDGKWIITSVLMDGKLTDVSEKSWEVAFTKAEGQVGAKICNSMGGKYTVTGKKIKFGAMRSTKMMCPDINYETAIGKAFADADNFEYDKNRMQLKKGDKILMILTMPV
jgi:heat shock protein HslJ